MEFILDLSTLEAIQTYMLGEEWQPSAEIDCHMPAHYPPISHVAVTYTSSAEDADAWVQTHVLDSPSACDIEGIKHVIGFDLEWKASFQAGVANTNKAALLQVSSAFGHVLLFPLRGKTSQSRQAKPNIINDIPPLLQHVLESSEYLKVGVAVANDGLRLKTDNNVSALCTADLKEFSTTLHNMRVELALGKDTFEKYLNLPLAFRNGMLMGDFYSKNPTCPVAEFLDMSDTNCSCFAPTPVSLASMDVVAIQNFMDSLCDHVKQPKNIAAIPSPTVTTVTTSLARPAKLVSYDTIVALFPTRPRIQLPKYSIKTNLTALTSRFLHLEITKNKKITMSDWELYPLDDVQIAYAALDAWTSQHIFCRIAEEMITLLMRNGSNSEEAHQILLHTIDSLTTAK